MGVVLHAMGVAVGVDQVGAFEEVAVLEDVAGWGVGD
jgi:hypothetical protein